MPDQYIHYVKRTILSRNPKDINSPWFSELQKYDHGFDKPVYHVTRSNSWPANIVKPGDTIWLVSQISSPWGKLPPSIDASIFVKSVDKIFDERGKIKFRFNAGNDSKWFPLADAAKIIEKLAVVSKNNKITKPYSQKMDNLGQAFQSMRKIHSLDIIRQWAQEVSERDLHFISYRVVDGTQMAFIKIDSLLKKDLCVFWDRWSLPRRLAERRELVSDKSLDLILTQNIQKAQVVWGIESPKYSETGSYSAKEKMFASSLGKYKPA